jgi:hypothetical protein
MIRKLILYSNTIRFLKFQQIYYRIYYLIINKIYRDKVFLLKPQSKVPNFLKYKEIYFNDKDAYLGNGTFAFLNISHKFNSLIDWELMKYGKLWQYNLSYFDYLKQISLSKQEGIDMIEQFLACPNLNSSIEPYPTSLRVINWIKFVSLNEIATTHIIDAIYNQMSYVSNKIEYHLLGNHVLENAFCLLHGGYFFKDYYFINLANNILQEQLEEQILEDGGHFELSPMYHQIILFRVLEAIDMLKYNCSSEETLLVYLEGKASKMISWLDNISFRNGDIPLVNDAALGVAPTTQQLKSISKSLKVPIISNGLSESGYRKYLNDYYEVMFDVGDIGPYYQAGHAHADTFNIILYCKNNPILVDTGISTYEANERRYIERGSSSHNGVTVQNKNHSQIWSSFRVAKRAKVFIRQDNYDSITAFHDGYKDLGVIHERKVIFSICELIIQDSIIGNNRNETATAHFHFHPNVCFKLVGNLLKLEDCQINFENAKMINEQDYYFAPEFNTQVLSKKIIVEFENTLTTKISFNSK